MQTLATSQASLFIAKLAIFTLLLETRVNEYKHFKQA